MTFKTIPQYPDFQINRDGVVKTIGTNQQLTPRTLSSPHGVHHVAVQIYSETRACLELLEYTFHVTLDKVIPRLMPRDGNFLNLKEDNLFPFEVSTNCRIRYTSDIQGVWRAAMVEQVPCNRMAERLNLTQFGAHEFRVLIGEILLAGIR